MKNKKEIIKHRKIKMKRNSLKYRKKVKFKHNKQLNNKQKRQCKKPY